MANCCDFHWLIRNPFLPWRNLEATFYHGSPTTTHWRVTLRPLERRVNFYRFSFSLTFDERFGIQTVEMMVLIDLNGKRVDEKKTPYEFNAGNRFTYDFQSFADFYPQTQPHLLHILVAIVVPSRVVQNEPGNGLFTCDRDLEWLSKNLDKLRHYPLYSNMNLMTSEGSTTIPVHSYILAARWNNFFKEHAFQEGVLDTVETNISHVLLWGILTYMYSGKIYGFQGPNWTDTAYTTELFQVIDRYKLYHLYKVFVKYDLKQLRDTCNNVRKVSLLFPLDSVIDRPINDASNTRQVDLYPEYRFIFQIRAEMDNRYGPWLSYSLQSKSPSRFIVQVTLEVVRKLGRDGPEDTERVSSFHEREYTIDSGSSVKSGPVFFLACPETFCPTSSDGTEIKNSIRCFLNFTDGTTVIRVMGVNDTTIQNDLERFRVLSDHMYALRTHLIHQDMTICSRPLGPGVPDEYQFQWPIHKAVLACRVPDFWGGLLGDPREIHPPDFATSTLSNETLLIVLDYLYTGKVFTIPIPYLGVMEDFAHRTMFYSLLYLLIRISSLGRD